MFVRTRMDGGGGEGVKHLLREESHPIYVGQVRLEIYL